MDSWQKSVLRVMNIENSYFQVGNIVNEFRLGTDRDSNNDLSE